MVLSIVLPLALILRTWQLEQHIPLYTDQARTLLAGRNIVLGNWLIQGPSTSVAGMSLGPLYYYLTAVALWFTQFHPIGPVMLSALLSTAAVVGLYFYVQKYWDWRLAELASLWLAISPLAITQGRIAVEPSPLPLVTLWWLWSTTAWIQSRRPRELASSLVAIVVGIQLNFSAIIWLGVFAVYWLFAMSSWSYRTRSSWLIAGLAGWGGVVIGKIWWSELTPLNYFWQMWQLISVPTIPIAAGILGILVLSQLVYLMMKFVKYVQPELRWPNTLSSADSLLAVWGLLSIMALTLKTVGGLHALNQWFVLWPILLATALEPMLTAKKWQPLLSVALVLMTLGWSSSTWLWLQRPPENTLQQHLNVVQRIITLSQGQPYNLVYRGDLDVYDAADDHYQYLLWWFGHEPTSAARIELLPVYQEPWLHPAMQTGAWTAPRTLYLYVPAAQLERYRSQGQVHGKLYPVGDQAIIEVRE